MDRLSLFKLMCDRTGVIIVDELPFFPSNDFGLLLSLFSPLLIIEKEREPLVLSASELKGGVNQASKIRMDTANKRAGGLLIKKWTILIRNFL